MTEGLIGYLRRDLRGALAAGVERTPLDPPGGGLWLSRWALVCLSVGLTLWLACGYQAGFARLNSAAAAHPGWIFQWLTTLGGEGVPFALSLFLARRYPRVFWALVLAALVAIAYNRGLKPLFDLPRPPAVLPADGFNLIGPGHRRSSFPSGHSVTAGVFWGVLVYYARWSWVRWLWILIAVAVALSRVAVGVHWPVDVAFGLLGGVLAAWGGARLAARWAGWATEPTLHLALVALGAICAVSLTLWDGGYPEARPLLQVIGWSALGFAGYGYLLRPLAAGLRARRSAPG